MTEPQPMAQPQPVAQPRPTAQQYPSNIKANATTFFNKNKKVILTILVILGALILVKTVFFRPAVISVVGVGKLTAKPDQSRNVSY